MSKHERAGCEEMRGHCRLHFRESWNSGSIYRPGDAVPYDGSSYVAIHWNQNDPPPSSNWANIAAKGDAGQGGAQGPVGPPGPVGPQGPAGISGASDLYAFAPSGEPQDINVGTDGQDVAQLALPPGSYLAMATVGLINFDSDQQGFEIRLFKDSEVIATYFGTAWGGGSTLGVPDPDFASLVIPILAAFTVEDSGATLILRVNGYSIHVRVPGTVQLMAIKVGTIHPVS